MKAMSRTEFIALMAMLSAMSAFGIDAMLPALPEIGAELSPHDPDRAQLLLSSFIFGMGLGTFVTGPLADAVGRRPIVAGGIALYIAGAALAWVSPTLETVLAGRLLMGLGAAGPRVAMMAIVRDRYHGVEMARLMSLVMVVFMLVPAIAPSVGALVMQGAGWRMIFPFFVVFGLGALAWFLLRQPESLSPDNRRPLRPRVIWAAPREMAAIPVVRLSILIQTLTFGMLFSMLNSVQGVFDHAYGQGDNFPLWFALIAAVSAAGSFLNSRLILSFGMLNVARGMFAAQVVLSGLMLLALALPLPSHAEFWVWLVWAASVFLQGSLTIGNVNAVAMQPLGHIAGLAASVIAALSTVGSVVIAAPIGLAGDGTARAVALGILALSALAFALALRLRVAD